MNEQSPLPRRTAAKAVARCAVTTLGLLARRRTHLPTTHVGLRLSFGDGSSADVYRETTIDRDRVSDPCVLVVAFRLRRIHGRAHTLFRWESILNTPLFVGFPGLVSKLWLTADEREVYRGIYEWDGPMLAERYARCLWRVLALVSEQGSIHYTVIPGLHRDDVLGDAHPLKDGGDAWWRVVEAA